MGQKGDKHTNEAQLSANLLLERLAEIEGITSKKMFGGYGIFHNSKMFGIVDSKGMAFLKSNLETPEKGSIKHSKMPYCSVPREINSSKLIELANHAISLSKG